MSVDSILLKPITPLTTSSKGKRDKFTPGLMLLRLLSPACWKSTFELALAHVTAFFARNYHQLLTTLFAPKLIEPKDYATPIVIRDRTFVSDHLQYFVDLDLKESKKSQLDNDLLCQAINPQIQLIPEITKTFSHDFHRETVTLIDSEGASTTFRPRLETKHTQQAGSVEQFIQTLYTQLGSDNHQLVNIILSQLNQSSFGRLVNHQTVRPLYDARGQTGVHIFGNGDSALHFTVTIGEQNVTIKATKTFKLSRMEPTTVDVGEIDLEITSTFSKQDRSMTEDTVMKWTPTISDQEALLGNSER